MDNFTSLSKNILSKTSLPNSWEIPSSFMLDSNIFLRLRGLKELTIKDERERAMSFYLAFDEVITGKYTLGDESSVSTGDNITAKLVPDKGYIKKLIAVNGSTQIDKKISLSEAEKLNKTIKHLASFHTHPIHYEREFKTWGFFSDVDMKTFISSNILSMGLITKSYWILIKTKEIGNFSVYDYVQLYNIEISKDQPYYQNLIEYMNKSGIIVYHSEKGQVYERRR